MSDDKPETSRRALFAEESPQRGDRPAREPDSESGREQQGWDAYRKWLKTMNRRPDARRAPVDHSVYSWKGYNSWADRVRQTWKTEES
jgi:hypothetical protein